MLSMQTPGIYINELNVFPNSVVEVATAVPAFVGYTQQADNQGKSLLNKPYRITSMADFHNYFGFAPSPLFDIVGQAAMDSVETSFSPACKGFLLTNDSEATIMVIYKKRSLVQAFAA